MKNILVVGGAGFVGSHLVRRLLETDGAEVITVFDNLSSGRFENLPTDRRVRFWQGNARDYDRLRVAMAGNDTVFHLAANPDISKAATEPTLDFDQGTVLTKNVLESVRVNGVKRLIYFSGSGVYGDTRDVLMEDHGPLEPVSPYGASKLASEAMICAYCHMFGILARAFRFANIVGPRQTHGVGFDFLRKLAANPGNLWVLGDGTQSKSYIHIDDVLEAVFIVAKKALSDEFETPVPYAVYNVATGDYLTVLQIAEMAIGMAGEEGARIHFTGGDRGWKGDVPVVRFNCGKIHALGWRCRRTSREAMQAALLAMADELAVAAK